MNISQRLILVFGALTLLTFNRAAEAASIDDGEYVGYLRAGAGVSQRGGPLNCFYLGNGDGHGYRLGNECDSYAEIGYARTFEKAEDGTRFVGRVMVEHYSPDSAYSGNLQISQIFVDAEGLSGLSGGTPWLGERYYERPDIHTMDLQYINLNGMGGGIDNITMSLGGTFSYAVFKDNDTNNYSGTALSNALTSSNSAVRNDFLYRGLPTNPGGKLDVIAGVITPSSPSRDRHWGYNAHVFHRQDVWGGGNTFGFQIGQGPGTGRGAPLAYNSAQPYAAFGSAGGAGPDALCCNRMGQSGSTRLGNADLRLRLFDAIWVQPTQDFSAAFDLLYQADRSPTYGGTSNWDSAGVRPVYALSHHFKLQGELGVDHVTYPGAASENLIKYTVAPTLALGRGFFDRPELRLYVTRANWNSAATGAINANSGSTTPASVGLVTASTTIGLQVEAWWGKDWF